MNSYKKLKRRFRAGNLFSRLLRSFFEKSFIRPMVGMQLLAGIIMISPFSILNEHPKELAYPGLGMSDIVLFASVEPVMTTQNQSMQNPAAEFLGISNYFRSGHAGYDFRAVLGSDIYPTTHGHIKAVVHSTHGYGRRVIVEHENGFESLYAHMGLIEVEEGQIVTKKTKLGEVGMTGMTTGPHIHVELYLNGVPVNPKYYIDLNDLPKGN